MTPNTSCLFLVPFGSHLGTTVGYPNYTKILQHMVSIPPYLSGIIVGLLLSDAWLQLANTGGQARLGMKQSLARSEYLLSVFFML
jgi:hypothetical protein